MYKRLGLILLVALALAAAPQVEAVVNPLAFGNNRYGMHIISEVADLTPVAELVNSNGGDWGYVTVVIAANDRSKIKWQYMFDQMRELRLIPIVRIATEINGDLWSKPALDDAKEWALFLDSLNWVIKNRYVVIFNEPNHAKEWGGEINPAEYATFLKHYSQVLRETSDDFFILPAGMDGAADGNNGTMPIEEFLQGMSFAVPDVFEFIDGWTSHSYPNPDFSGKTTDTGKMSIKGYRWEIDFLKSMGYIRDWPVFITETGWVRSDWIRPRQRGLTADEVAGLFTEAFQNVWVEPEIVAITPFILNYGAFPFDKFSWALPGGEGYYPQYEAVKQISKNAGIPLQRHRAELVDSKLPASLVTDSHYQLELKFKNTGHSIWQEGLELKMLSSSALTVKAISKMPKTRPYTEGKVTVDMETNYLDGTYDLSFWLEKDGVAISPIVSREVKIIAPPSLTVSVSTGYRKDSSGDDFTLMIFDESTPLVTFEGLVVEAGRATLDAIHDVVPGKVYRFVVLKPYYLPRQAYGYLAAGHSEITFNRLMPLDYNQDGKLSWQDVGGLIKNPRKSFSLLF